MGTNMAICTKAYLFLSHFLVGKYETILIYKYPSNPLVAIHNIHTQVLGATVTGETALASLVKFIN